MQSRVEAAEVEDKGPLPDANVRPARVEGGQIRADFPGRIRVSGREEGIHPGQGRPSAGVGERLGKAANRSV